MKTQRQPTALFPAGSLTNENVLFSFIASSSFRQALFHFGIFTSTLDVVAAMRAAARTARGVRSFIVDRSSLVNHLRTLSTWSMSSSSTRLTPLMGSVSNSLWSSSAGATSGTIPASVASAASAASTSSVASGTSSSSELMSMRSFSAAAATSSEDGSDDSSMMGLSGKFFDLLPVPPIVPTVAGVTPIAGGRINVPSAKPFCLNGNTDSSNLHDELTTTL